MEPNDIPLTTVRSKGSTGARKPGPNRAASIMTEKTKGDAHRRHWGRRQKLNKKIGRAADEDDDSRSLNVVGRFYKKIINASVVTRYLVYILPVGILLSVPLVVLGITDHKNDIPLNHSTDDKGVQHPGPPLFKLFEWILITWLTLWAAKVVAWLIPKVFTTFTGFVSIGTKKYATVLANLNIPISLFLWALAVYVTFKNYFGLSSRLGVSWVVTLERVLGATFVSLAVLLIEKAFVQLIGVSYHQRSFANRIAASKREVHLLTMLYDASRTLFPPYCQEFAEEDYVISDGLEVILKKKSGKSTGVATPMKIIGDVSRFADKATSAVGHVAHEITGKQVLNPNSSHSIVLEALEKLGPSEALARRIWMSFVIEGNDALYLEDFQEVLGPAYKDEAEEAFYAIDNDMNGDVSLDEMIRKVVDIGRERKAIGEGMKDIGQALQVFDSVLLFVVLLITIFIFLAWFKSSFVTTLTTAGTALLSLSFIFAVTTQEFLGSCIFLFVKHPYDVGDRVDITDIKMTVERISLLYTVFVRLDTSKTTQIPNIVLNGLWIDNISRSKAMFECFTVDVFYGTSFEDIELLRAEMEKFVRAPENTRDFQPDFAVSVGSVNALDKLSLNISIKHKSNWHNEGVRATRRSKFMCALALAFKRVPIYGPSGNSDPVGAASNPAYSVTVSDDFATKARGNSSKTKDEARMVPLATQTEEEKLAAEEAAASELNNRPVVSETVGLWDRDDDRTLDPTDMSAEDIARNRDLESIRADLAKSTSQRGRRRVGETISPTTSNQDGGFSSMHGSPAIGSHGDEESRTGMPTSFYDMTRGNSGGSTNHLRPSNSLQRPTREISMRSLQGRRAPPPPRQI